MTYFFQVHTCNDFNGLRHCLKSVRKYMPDVFIQVISDGDYMNEQEKEFVKANADQLVIGKALMAWKENGTAWVERRLRLALGTGKDVCLKIDTDTRVWRKLNYIPEAAYFGTVRTTKTPSADRYVQGGCLGMHREFMQALIDGNFFGGPEWIENMPWWAVQERANPHLVSGDGALAEIAAREFPDVKPFMWDEVKSVYSHKAQPDPEYPHNPLLYGVPRYAITHPHKESSSFVIGNPNTGILFEDAKDAQWRNFKYG